MTLKELEMVIRDFESVEIQYKHKLHPKDYSTVKCRVLSNPTISDSDAFELKEPSAISNEGLTHYVDRVIIPSDISEANLKEILDSMFKNFRNSMFFFEKEVRYCGFKMPGYEKWFREKENGQLEIRLCAVGFNT